MFIPFESVVIPLYTNFANLGLVGTLQGTALVCVGLGVPFAVFLVTSYFRPSQTASGSRLWSTAPATCGRGGG